MHRESYKCLVEGHLAVHQRTPTAYVTHRQHGALLLVLSKPQVRKQSRFLWLPSGKVVFKFIPCSSLLFFLLSLFLSSFIASLRSEPRAFALSYFSSSFLVLRQGLIKSLSCSGSSFFHPLASDSQNIRITAVHNHV